MVIDPEIDTINYVNVNNPNAREEVIALMNEMNLFDAWRELNMEKRMYSWHKKNSNKQARLDFFLISDIFGTDLQDSKILPGYRSDHSICIC